MTARRRALAGGALVVAVVAIVWAITRAGGGQSGGTAPPPPPPPPLTKPPPAAGRVSPWVTTQGSRFVDQQGRTVVLRGFDVGVGNPTAYEQAPQLGANLVRIYVPWSDVEPRAPTGQDSSQHHWDEALLAELDQEVRFLESARVNVLIDFHQFHWSPWYAQAECKSGAPVCNASGVPAWYYQGRYGQDRGAESRAKAAFWTTERRASLGYYAAFAEMMAGRYGRFPNVLGYEVFNEPHPGALPDTTATTNLMLRWQATIAREIQAVDPARTVVVMCRGGGEGIGTANLGLVRGPHVALDFHDYFNGHPGYGFDQSGDSWTPSWPATHNQDAQGAYTGSQAAQAAVLDVPASRARRFGMPLLVGEWGIHTGTPGADVYQRQMLAVFDRAGASWTRWNLGTGGGFAVLDQNGAPTAEAVQLAGALTR